MTYSKLSVEQRFTLPKISFHRILKYDLFKISMQLQERVKCSTLSHVSTALLNDLSKAFDCIDHKPLITKMDAVGFDSLSLNFLSFYLKKRNQRTKLNPFYNSWADILFDLRQDSILRPRLFTQSKIP